jgi:3-dehydroquinate synthetase
MAPVVDLIETVPAQETKSISKPAGSMKLKTHLKSNPVLYFGNRCTEGLGSLLKGLEPDCVYLVTTPLLLNLYGEGILNAVEKQGLSRTVVTIQDGEENKIFRTLEVLCEMLVERGVSKASVIVGLGGGCLTNIAGLAAGLIFRGIRYVEMPTTMMGITDSCLSNKQAVNGAHGKNHFGIYYAPAFLFSDTHYLVSEPIPGKKAAIVEGIKNGLISDLNLIDYFQAVLQQPLEQWDEMDFHDLTYRIVCSKLRILEADPTEKAFGMTLEYGHTFGHAIEFLTQGRIHHGLAVAKGMCIAAELSCRLGYLIRVEADRHYELFGSLLGLDLSIPPEIGVDEIVAAMAADNKKTFGGTKFVLLKRIGECMNPDGDYQVFVDPQVVREVLEEYKGKADWRKG